MHEMPELDIHIVPSRERPGGFGEHPVPMVAPAVANAVFAATGIRVRRLPITPSLLESARDA
jgi:isoquinoline 1-oxidoreductase beta subunit